MARLQEIVRHWMTEVRRIACISEASYMIVKLRNEEGCGVQVEEEQWETGVSIEDSTY